MPKQIVNNIPGATPPLPVFSQAAIANGNVYVSGSIGADKEFNLVGGIESQSRAALENMKALLQGSGSGLEHVIKVNIYMTNMTRDFGTFNDIYKEFFSNPKTLPARTCIGVAALPMGALVEVECVAELAKTATIDNFWIYLIPSCVSGLVISGLARKWLSA